LSPEPDASRWPSGEKATDRTQSRWPSSVWRHCPEAVSQTLTVLSPEPDTSCWPSGEKATDQTQPRWPSSVWR
ncbi:hypothetical protein B0H67DRAFT_462454, partial [Lasiosphaeris hirsuta]